MVNLKFKTIRNAIFEVEMADEDSTFAQVKAKVAELKPDDFPADSQKIILKGLILY